MGRKIYNYVAQGDNSAGELKSAETTNQQIAHIHKSCEAEIKASWQPDNTDEANIKIIRDMKKEHPGKKKELDLLEASIQGRADEEIKELYNLTNTTIFFNL